MRRPVIAGNWKMYKTIAEAVAYVEKLKLVAGRKRHCEVLIAPAFTALAAAAEAARGSEVKVAAQDDHWDTEGAHTGDVSAPMLVEAGRVHGVHGHSASPPDHNVTHQQRSRELQAD